MVTSICLLQIENGKGKLPFFSANGSGIQKFVFFGGKQYEENRTNGNNGNFRLFAANGKRKPQTSVYFCK
jgi:hypothetical protein